MSVKIPSGCLRVFLRASLGAWVVGAWVVGACAAPAAAEVGLHKSADTRLRERVPWKLLGLEPVELQVTQAGLQASRQIAETNRDYAQQHGCRAERGQAHPCRFAYRIARLVDLDSHPPVEYLMPAVFRLALWESLPELPALAVDAWRVGPSLHRFFTVDGRTMGELVEDTEFSGGHPLHRITRSLAGPESCRLRCGACPGPGFDGRMEEKVRDLAGGNIERGMTPEVLDRLEFLPWR